MGGQPRPGLPTTTTSDPTELEQLVVCCRLRRHRAGRRDDHQDRRPAHAPSRPGCPTLATLVVTNNGPSTARVLTVVDTYNGDAAASQFRAPPDFCHATRTVELECTTPDLAPQHRVQPLLFSALVLFDVPGTYVNSWRTVDDDPGVGPPTTTRTRPTSRSAAPQVELSMDKAAAGPIVAGGRLRVRADRHPTAARRSPRDDHRHRRAARPAWSPTGCQTPGWRVHDQPVRRSRATCPVVVPTVSSVVFPSRVPITIVGVVRARIVTP